MRSDERQPFYVWGFPGVGKSSLKSSHSIIDADCTSFQFLRQDGDHSAFFLHDEHANSEVICKNPDYPQNYLDYIQHQDADFILINCHISLLNVLNPDKVLLVYPAPEQKEEYLARYLQRGDHPSFLEHMETSFEETVAAIQYSPFRKYEIKESGVFLQDLFDGGVIMDQFMTKKELAQLFRESQQLGVFAPPAGLEGKTPEEWAQMLFDGDFQADLSALKRDLATKKEELAQEKLMDERRCGLSHEELRDKIMQGIVNGALTIHHGQIAPYSYGYEVSFAPDAKIPGNRWECYCDLAEVAETVTRKIEGSHQDREAFSSTNLQPVNLPIILAAIEQCEKDKITSFVLERDSGFERRGRYTGHVANLRNVHGGQALDGIILGHFQGDYSSITTIKQNETMRVLVAMKGFCLDCINHLKRPYQNLAVEYLKTHGTDISTPEKLNAWIKANPDKCGLPENRTHAISKNKRASLDTQISHAEEKKPNAPVHEERQRRGDLQKR